MRYRALGSKWQDGQYVRDRRLEVVKPAFEDLLNRFHTDYMDLGMIRYIDADEEYDRVMSGSFMEYVRRAVRSGR